ncbi:hypothetical protein L7F22_017232 [Adiantum nelumboides]|nr:hypothetical protein [Adiantum nelumboides]
MLQLRRLVAVLLTSLLAMVLLQLQQFVINAAAEEEDPGRSIREETLILNVSKRREAQYAAGAGSALRRNSEGLDLRQRDTQRRRSYAAMAARERHNHQHHKITAGAPDINSSELINPYTNLMDFGLPPDTWTIPLEIDSHGQPVVTLQIGGGANVPPLKQSVILDTGSSITWVSCNPSDSEQHHQTDPRYDVEESKTFRYIDCEDSICELLPEQDRYCEEETNYCLFGKTYADKSKAWGFWGLDTIRLGIGLGFSSWKADNVPIGCAFYSDLAFIKDVAGILGFGQGGESIVSTKGSSFGSSFSYCLPRKDSKIQGYLKLGVITENPQRRWTKLLKSPFDPRSYFVPLVGLRVNHEDLPIDPTHFRMDPSNKDKLTGVMLDTGSSATYFPAPIYKTIRDALHESMSDSGFEHIPGSFGGLETCYKLPFQDLKLVDRLPNVQFVFEGGVSWPIDNYNLFGYLDTSDIHCFIFLDQRDEELQSVTIIGDVQMRGTDWTYDLANDKIGFITGVCLD